MPYRKRPKPELRCLDCGLDNGMKLQNTVGTISTNVPLLYVCVGCGCHYTVPPPSRNALQKRDPSAS